MPHAITGDETVANCITSLRMLATQDWQDFFESVSRVEHILRDDPAHVYANMDQETRDRYRKVIEKSGARHRPGRAIRRAPGD